MSNFLAEMATGSCSRAAAISRKFRAADFDLPVARIAFSAFDLIAEIKERSPAVGDLTEFASDRGARARQYVQGGAAAISVLTEPSRFAGSMQHLEEVVRAVTGTDVPVMRKDFLVDRKQLLEARAAGASGVLLIVALLTNHQLVDLLACAREHSLFVLLEAFDEVDVRRIGELLEQAPHAASVAKRELLVGINARDLRTLAVDNARFARLAPLLPEGTVRVAESGIRKAEDAATAAALGYQMGLVGSALMQTANPAVLVNEMLLAGRPAFRAA
jgi:indole-3-glycerol phosphate synthase